MKKCVKDMWIPVFIVFMIFSQGHLLYASTHKPPSPGGTYLYEQYPYLNFLFHASSRVKLETGIKLKSVTWSTSNDVKKDPAHGNYTRVFRTAVVSAGMIIFL